jgi:hypothetical protein
MILCATDINYNRSASGIPEFTLDQLSRPGAIVGAF